MREGSLVVSFILTAISVLETYLSQFTESLEKTEMELRGTQDQQSGTQYIMMAAKAAPPYPDGMFCYPSHA